MDRHEKALEILHNGTVIPAIPLVLDQNRKFDPLATLLNHPQIMQSYFIATTIKIQAYIEKSSNKNFAFYCQ